MAPSRSPPSARARPSSFHAAEYLGSCATALSRCCNALSLPAARSASNRSTGSMGARYHAAVPSQEASMLRMLHAAAAALLFALAPAAHAQKEREVSIGLQAAITSIDPHYHNLSPNNSMLQHIFEPLIKRDANQKLVPGLATSWKAIDDLTWEFKLRKSVRWHDGSPFTADDVLFTLKRVPDVPNSPSSFATFT